MISIRATTLAKSIKAVRDAKGKLVGTADARFRKNVMGLFKAAVGVSPQFSGDFASNWYLVVDDRAVPAYKMWPGKQGMDRKGGMLALNTVHQAGDPEAVNFAVTRANFTRGITRTSKIRFVNATQLTTDGTHMIGPDGREKLRDVNVIPGNVRIESYLRAVAKGMK